VHGNISTNKKPPNGYKNPLEALFSPPSGKFFHISLQKVKVMFFGLFGA
jgi:hypothetical protein